MNECEKSVQLSSTTTISSTEEITGKPNNCRLGKCEVCNSVDAKYVCPKCEIRTCGLKCLQIHKRELNCTGIAERTKYISIKNMSENDYLRDYHFLEECTRFVNNCKTTSRKIENRKRKFQSPHYKKNISSSSLLLACPTVGFGRLGKLCGAAKERNIKLYTLKSETDGSRGCEFTRTKLNTSYYDNKLNIIYWHIDWIFKNAGDFKCNDQRCSETERLGTLLEKYFNNDIMDNVCADQLKYYQSRGLSRCRLLLKAERVRNCDKRYYELDPMETLKLNLKGKCIIEYPIVHIVFEEDNHNYEIIDSDDDIETETKLHLNQYNIDLQNGNAELTNKRFNGRRRPPPSSSSHLKYVKKTSSSKLTNLLFPDDNEDHDDPSD